MDGGVSPSWTSDFSLKLLALARARGAYVDTHTAYNPLGELRGQIKLR